MKIQQLLCSICENISVSGFAAAILDSCIGLSFYELHCFVAQSFPVDDTAAERPKIDSFENSIFVLKVRLS